MTFENYKELRNDNGTIASIAMALGQLGIKDEIIPLLVKDFAGLCGSPRGMELQDDSVIFAYLHGFGEGLADAKSIKEEWEVDS